MKKITITKEQIVASLSNFEGIDAETLGTNMEAAQKILMDLNEEPTMDKVFNLTSAIALTNVDSSLSLLFEDEEVDEEEDKVVMPKL